ncbi:hypothetical protein FVEN_g3950 [Fusarium venenatum]|uniref:uncharacterized protein n=1 Tax=Fusarium venenatum TaxID=56646 RepID=UPI001D9F54FB|nr:hypothetical protein FVEN_g3950 [Fusarium venenatum]KAH6966063.1 hypothetical protein EDB82DRAFT_561832 [Fusarium venenatum]
MNQLLRKFSRKGRVTPDPSADQQAASPSKKIFPSGIKLLHDGQDNIVDIIFVHGLTGHREKTWRAKTADKPWHETLLPTKVPNARILTFGYDAYVTNWKSVMSQSTIGNHSMNLLTAVATFRENDDTNNRPIIFVCHSLGGLVCEDALSMAQTRPEQHLKQVLLCTRGIIFLGTPHHGSGLAHWAEAMAKSIGLLKQTNPAILGVLRSNSEVLARVQMGFHTMIQARAQDKLPQINITCFFEELPLPGVGPVVPRESAILPGYIPIGIHGNHMDMTKFDDASDPGFIAISGEISRWVRRKIIDVVTEDSGVLGQLRFRDPEHGWALDIGAQLPRFDLLSGTLTDESVPGISTARRELVDEVNRILRRRNFRYTVPDVIPGQNQIREITDEILDEMSYRHTASHMACFLIGSANYYLGMAQSTRPDVVAEFTSLARNRMQFLDLKCGMLGIKSMALLDQMARTANNGISIRQLLSTLSDHNS